MLRINFNPAVNINFNFLWQQIFPDTLRLFMVILTYFQFYLFQYVVNLCELGPIKVLGNLASSPVWFKLVLAIASYQIFKSIEDKDMGRFTIDFFVILCQLHGAFLLICATKYFLVLNWGMVLKGNYSMTISDWKLLGLIYIVVFSYFTS